MCSSVKLTSSCHCKINLFWFFQKLTSIQPGTLSQICGKNNSTSFRKNRTVLIKRQVNVAEYIPVSYSEPLPSVLSFLTKLKFRHTRFLEKKNKNRKSSLDFKGSRLFVFLQHCLGIAITYSIRPKTIHCFSSTACLFSINSVYQSTITKTI